MWVFIKSGKVFDILWCPGVEAISFLYACVLSSFSPVQLCATPWTVAHQAPLSMGFSRQEYWSGLPCYPPGDLPDPGIKPISLKSSALANGFFTTSITSFLCIHLWKHIFLLSTSVKLSHRGIMQLSHYVSFPGILRPTKLFFF